MKNEIKTPKKVKPAKVTLSEQAFDYNNFIQQSSSAYKKVLLHQKRRLESNGQSFLEHASFGPGTSSDVSIQTIILNEDGSLFERDQVRSSKGNYNSYYFIFADGLYTYARTDEKAENLEEVTIIEDTNGVFHEIHSSMLPIENCPITFEQIRDAIFSFDKPQAEKETAGGPKMD